MHMAPRLVLILDCELLLYVSAGNREAYNFDSRPVAAGTANADLPTFEITVNDTAPIWGYCMQVNPPNPTHCQSGMVFGINPPAMGNTFEKFLAMAKASGNSTDSTTTTTATEAQFTSTVVVFEEGETTTVTSSEFQFTSTVVVFEEGETTTVMPYATSAAGKSTFNLAASSTGSDSDAEKLLNKYAPVVVGLLAATLALLLAVLGVGAALSRRVMARPSRSMALRRNSRYSQVSLNVPELGEYTGLSKENNNRSNEMRYAESGEYTDRV